MGYRKLKDVCDELSSTLIEVYQPQCNENRLYFKLIGKFVQYEHHIISQMTSDTREITIISKLYTQQVIESNEKYIDIINIKIKDDDIEHTIHLSFHEAYNLKMNDENEGNFVIRDDNGILKSLDKFPGNSNVINMMLELM
jgi:hypothetical protein